MDEIAKADLGASSSLAQPINWRSHPQVLKVLKELGLLVKDTNSDSLKPLINKHRIVPVLLEYRKQSKLVSTYGSEKWDEYINQETGRIYPRWWQIRAVTGRMSCSGPNMQNLPRDEAYRACFKAPKGRILIKGDYDQIELRIAAELSGDNEMIRTYQAGEKDGRDLHKRTAAHIGRKESLKDVTEDERQRAKVLNFGLIYGMGSQRLAMQARNQYKVELTETEAEQFKVEFFRLYSGLKTWQQRHWTEASRIGETRTIAGRQCLFPDEPRYTESLNWPIQGTGADGIKLALAYLWENPGPEGAIVVSVIHDEIIIEAPADKADEAKLWLKNAMESAMGEFLKTVPGVEEPEIVGSK